MMAKWMGYFLPGIIPTDTLDVLQKVSRDYLVTMISFIESILNIAKKADDQHHEIKPAPVTNYVNLEEKIDFIPKPTCEVIVTPAPEPQNREIILTPEKLKKEPETNTPLILFLERRNPQIKKPS